ncbi:MAG: carboxypeptidase-like regulatory domain-containing protein [bacterium]
MIAAPTIAVVRRRQRMAAIFVVSLVAGCSSDHRDGPPEAVAASSAVRAPLADAAVIPFAASSYVGTDVVIAGSVGGIVHLASPIAPMAPSATGVDSVLCGVSIPDESVREKAGALEGVVVWLEGVHSGRAIPFDRRIELESDHCKFIPRVQATVIGSAVNIIGHDYLRQHLRFVAAGESRVRASILLGGGEQVIPTELPFTSPGLVRIRDADHAWVSAYVAVFDHPYFAVTSATGTFKIEGVPPGTYTLRAWHERGGTISQKVQVAGGNAVNVELSLTGK